MNWIEWVTNRFSSKNQKPKQHKDNQEKIVLLAIVPLFIVNVVALLLTNISPYLIAFILIVLFLLCLYVVVASKKNSAYQIRTLSNLIESMIGGDYSLRGRLQTNPAFQELLMLINQLADTLSKHRIEAKESRLLLERIMEQMDAMIIATDEAGLVVMANASANKLLLGNSNPINTSSQSIELSSLPIGHIIKNSKSGIIEFTRANDTAIQAQLSGEHFLFKESFLSEGKNHTLYMLTNAERLLMEKERNAWQSLLRVLSHELNNSLTPITAISQSMQSKLKKSIANPKHPINVDTLLDGAAIINERAESLSRFIASYSQLSHLPKPHVVEINLLNMLDSMVTLFPEVEFEVSIAPQLSHFRADKGQFEQVIINVLKNGLEAMQDMQVKLIHISCTKDNQWFQIIITDNGSGIANTQNLFVPFYTTKNKGSGIGLALCRQIMFNHNGLIDLQNKANSGESGAEVTLSFPVT